MPDWICKHHSELSSHELYALLQLRSEVFVVEQNCAFQDLDGKDLYHDTAHLMGWQGDTLLAYARLLEPSLHQGQAVIGRVIVATSARGQGLGHTLMRRALEAVHQRWPDRPIYLGAQAHLQAYYARHGFVPVSEPYLEHGIAHLGMRNANVV
jgi:ElaA protein